MSLALGLCTVAAALALEWALVRDGVARRRAEAVARAGRFLVMLDGVEQARRFAAWRDATLAERALDRCAWADVTRAAARLGPLWHRPGRHECLAMLGVVAAAAYSVRANHSLADWGPARGRSAAEALEHAETLFRGGPSPAEAAAMVMAVIQATGAALEVDAELRAIIARAAAEAGRRGAK